MEGPGEPQRKNGDRKGIRGQIGSHKDDFEEETYLFLLLHARNESAADKVHAFLSCTTKSSADSHSMLF